MNRPSYSLYEAAFMACHCKVDGVWGTHWLRVQIFDIYTNTTTQSYAVRILDDCYPHSFDDIAIVSAESLRRHAVPAAI